MPTEQSYQEAITGYTAQLRTLFIPPEMAADAGLTTRADATLPADVLAERSVTLADTLEQVGTLTAGYLDAEDRAVREAAEMKLLAQATAEFQVARRLFAVAAEESEGGAGGATTRAGLSTDIQSALDELIAVLEQPLEMGVAVEPTRAVADRPKDPAQARADLQNEVEASLRLIVRQAGRTGSQAAQTLVLMDPETLKQGVALVSKDVAQVVDQVVAGVTQFVRQLVASAVRLLLQAYDWVLALLGKDVEAQARKQVGAWVDDLKKERKEGEPGLVDQLVDRLYTPDKVKSEVAGWLKASQANVEKVNQAAETVAGLGKKYEAKTDQVRNFLKVIGLMKVVPIGKLPQIQAIAAAVTLGLLGYTLYSGYDHVDSGRVTFSERFGVNIPDRVEGVRETVQKALK
jgi:hypothetical protein